MSGGGRPGARVAVKMEVAPFYSEEGLELLPDFVQLPGFGGGPGVAGPTGLEPAEESGADPQHKLLLGGKKQPRDLVGAASPSAALPPAGPFSSLRSRAGANSTVHRLIQEAPGGVGGPEVGPGGLQPLLKLPAAADLEQLLIQAGSPGLAGPASPTGGGPSVAAATGGPFLYRPPQPSAQQLAVTQEQEGFADGFVKALADLHKQNQLLGVPPAPLSPTQHPGGPCCPPSRQESPAVYTTLGGFSPASPSAGGTFFSPQAVARLPAPGSTGRALEEPQTVPEAPVVVVPPPPPAPSSGESPPPPSSLSPLDAESQERLKAERKRLRNRIAASKCRRRKLERIARLEEKVKALKGQNAELAATASLLRAQVTQLQGRVRSHLSSGCHINAAAAAPAQTSAASSQPSGREGPPEPEASAC
ncbi:transcription factor JunD-like [Hemicordylus capensis]|uniref:transcription factor JunD-like n=1 Tax=Hemicordylus capensis TaxID=884348 RepID=UPI002303154F|nr:transcription factor JunD-like [Hemicordylus capensis]